MQAQSFDCILIGGDGLSTFFYAKAFCLPITLMNPDMASSPGGQAVGSSNTTPRRVNTANAATQNPQAGTRFISSCNRCRRRKIKCDPGIPSCHACAESNTTCEYHDSSSNTDLPRARIIGLEQHLQHLLEQEAQMLQRPATQSGNVNIEGTLQPEFRGRLVVSGIRLACSKFTSSPLLSRAEGESAL